MMKHVDEVDRLSVPILQRFRKTHEYEFLRLIAGMIGESLRFCFRERKLLDPRRTVDVVFPSAVSIARERSDPFPRPLEPLIRTRLSLDRVCIGVECLDPIEIRVGTRCWAKIAARQLIVGSLEIAEKKIKREQIADQVVNHEDDLVRPTPTQAKVCQPGQWPRLETQSFLHFLGGVGDREIDRSRL